MVSSELQPRRRTARATARGLAAGGRARRTREGAKVEAGAAGQEHWSRRRSWDSRTGAGAGVQPSRTRLAEQLAAASRCAWARDRTRSPGRGWRRRRGGWRLALAGWLLGFCSGLRENFVFFWACAPRAVAQVAMGAGPPLEILEVEDASAHRARAKRHKQGRCVRQGTAMESSTTGS
jgi:hypothetical protein